MERGYLVHVWGGGEGGGTTHLWRDDPGLSLTRPCSDPRFRPCLTVKDNLNGLIVPLFFTNFTYPYLLPIKVSRYLLWGGWGREIIVINIEWNWQTIKVNLCWSRTYQEDEIGKKLFMFDFNYVCQHIYKETKSQTNVLVIIVYEQSFFKNIFNTHCWSIASFLRQFNLIIIVMPILKIKFASSLDTCFLLPRIIENRRGR